MKSISYFRYQLTKKKTHSLNATEAASSAREGALLRFEFEEKSYGYADIFPWPEFGDSDLDQQIELLKRGKETLLLQRSIDLAKKDHILRAEKKNAMLSEQGIENHFLVTDLQSLNDVKLAELTKLGFKTLKIKLGTDFEAHLPQILKIIDSTDFKIRLDFNATLNWSQFEIFVKAISFEQRMRIEFIEDPMPWNPVLWKKASQHFPLALDFEYSKVSWGSLVDAPFKYLVLKPARQNPKDILEKAFEFDCKIVVTSSLDHAVGIAHAAAIASELNKSSASMMALAGLQSHHVYVDDNFTRYVASSGPVLKAANGLGIGFDSELESLPWFKLS